MADTTRDPLEHFAYELLCASGLDALPEDAKAQFVVRLRDEAQRRMGIIAVQHLDAPGLEEFNGMMAKATPPDPNTVQEFFVARVPDFETKMREGLRTFAEEFVMASNAR